MYMQTFLVFLLRAHSLLEPEVSLLHDHRIDVYWLVSVSLSLNSLRGTHFYKQVQKPDELVLGCDQLVQLLYYPRISICNIQITKIITCRATLIDL